MIKHVLVLHGHRQLHDDVGIPPKDEDLSFFRFNCCSFNCFRQFVSSSSIKSSKSEFSESEALECSDSESLNKFCNSLDVFFTLLFTFTFRRLNFVSTSKSLEFPRPFQSTKFFYHHVSFPNFLQLIPNRRHSIHQEIRSILSESSRTIGIIRTRISTTTTFSFKIPNPL